MRKVFLLALVGLLLIASIEAAKKGGKEQKGKNAKEAAKVEKGGKAEKGKQIKGKAEKQKAHKVEETPVVEEELEDPVIEEPEEPVQHLCPHAAAAAAAGHPVHPPADAVHTRLVKPKSLKVLSEYEQCKLGCKTQRDQVTAAQYVEQLRAELSAAEQALHDQVQAVAAAETQIQESVFL